MHEITFYLICYFLKVVVRLVPMELLAAMAYLSSPSTRRITIICVPIHTKPALGPVESSARHPAVTNRLDVFHAEGFSTMRRFDSTFDTTDPHEAFKPPADGDADAPAEPETEREEAVDDAPAAPDEASSDP